MSKLLAFAIISMVDSVNDNCYHYHYLYGNYSASAQLQPMSMPEEFENLSAIENLALASLDRQITKPMVSDVSAISKSITSESLFAGARELIISHAGGEYRLRLTSQGKLILTK